MAFSIPAEAEWLSSTKNLENDDYDQRSPMDSQTPQHPVPTMQGAFEESMMETMTDMAEPESDARYSKADSISRRKMLLEQERYERSVAGKWKQKPGEKFHPLWKLVAQISFGMHLLYRGLAKSDEEVIKILQTHVDEVDGFLERTTEDFDLAQNDINERIRYLRLPLDHGQVFDSMLNDRAFRMAIVQGNEKIEHIVNRTAIAMKDALKDVQKGLDATRELARYLTRLERTWTDRSEENESVYLAMIGNTEGWSRAFMTLQQKGNKLGSALVQLEGIIAEIQKRAGIASRKNIVPVRPMEGKYFVEPKSSTTSSKHSTPPPSSPRKPLPTAPKSISEVVQSIRSHSSALKSPKPEQPQSPAMNSTPKPKKIHSQEVVNNVKPPASGHTVSTGTSSVGVDVHELLSKPVDSPLSLKSAKPRGRRVSFKERTHSFARKTPLFEDQEGAKSPNSLPIQMPPVRSSPRSTGASSPMSDPWRLSPLIGQKEKRRPVPQNASESESTTKEAENILTKAMTYPINTSFSPLEYPRSANSPTSSVHSLHSIDSNPGHTTVLVATHTASEGRLMQAHPLLRDIRVKEVRFSTTAPGSPLKPTIRDLPLRHYHSQDALSLTSDRDSKTKGPTPPRRTSSLSVKQAPSFAPLTGSSVYTPESQPSTGLPIQGQSSSTYSPEAPSASVYSNSPLATGLSQPYAQSSAAPSPLRVRLKNSPSGPKSAPLKLTRLPLPALSPTGSPSATPPPIARRKDVPMPILTATRDAATATTDDSNNEADSDDEIEASATLHQASFAPSPSSHKHKISDTSLIDYLVSTPASASPIPTNSIASTQASAKTNTTTASAKYRMLQLHSKPIPSPMARPPQAGSIPTTPSSHLTNDAHSDKHSGKSSPWRKVFGSSHSTSTPHRRSKSEKEKVIIIPTKKLEELRSKHRKGNASTSDAGFLGMGKDGVWISRKNFLKA